MAEYTPLNTDYGVRQGRIEPVNFAADETYAFALGSDRPNHGEYLRVGDFMTLAQMADVGATKIMKMRVRLRGPSYMPGDAKWVFSLYVNGVVVESTRHIAVVKQTTDYADIAINLAPYVGVATLALVLRLEEGV